MAAYYNEIDKFAAQWLRSLISAGHIAAGDVDERSIVDVKPLDLKGYTQCHFFAGIGGWSYALRLAGWADNREAWSGSCPCQPLSCAGSQLGHADARHLWPAFHSLIGECKPPIVFGEQVASKDGREWFSAVRADLEALGYAVGGADLCAASVGAPHERQRLFWMADAAGERGRRRASVEARGREAARGSSPDVRAEPWPDGRSSLSTVAVTDVLTPSHGIPGRMGLLRGYGNAIVPQVAAEFIMALSD